MYADKLVGLAGRLRAAGNAQLRSGGCSYSGRAAVAVADEAVRASEALIGSSSEDKWAERKAWLERVGSRVDYHYDFKGRFPGAGTESKAWNESRRWNAADRLSRFLYAMGANMEDAVHLSGYACAYPKEDLTTDFSKIQITSGWEHHSGSPRVALAEIVLDLVNDCMPRLAHIVESVDGSTHGWPDHAGELRRWAETAPAALDFSAAALQSAAVGPTSHGCLVPHDVCDCWAHSALRLSQCALSVIRQPSNERGRELSYSDHGLTMFVSGFHSTLAIGGRVFPGIWLARADYMMTMAGHPSAAPKSVDIPIPASMYTAMARRAMADGGRAEEMPDGWMMVPFSDPAISWVRKETFADAGAKMAELCRAVLLDLEDCGM